MQEAGRSMVEMLGVLAIVGVLSVVGTAGYRHALDNYKVNEILYSLNQNAMIVSTQKLMGQAITLLDDSIVLSSNNTDTFTFTIKDVSPTICSKIKVHINNWNTVFLDSTDCASITDMKFTFNNDLSDISATTSADSLPTTDDQPSTPETREECIAKGGKWCDNGCNDSSYECLCPQNGHYGTDGATCCNDKNQPWKNYSYYGEDIEKCGCPYDETNNALGEMTDNVCCYAGKSWNPVNHQYSKIDIACGCPADSNGLDVRYTGTICCNSHNQPYKPISGIYEGNDIENCGCPYDDQTGNVGILKAEKCCSDGRIWNNWSYALTNPLCNEN